MRVVHCGKCGHRMVVPRSSTNERCGRCLAAMELFVDAPPPEAAKAAESAPGGATSLEPLRCAACHGPVPLRDGASARCPFCSATMALPEAYRSLLRTRAQSARQLAELHALYARLSVEPHPALLWWASGGGVLAAVLRFALTGVGRVALFVLRGTLQAKTPDYRVAVLLGLGLLVALGLGQRALIDAAARALGLDLVLSLGSRGSAALFGGAVAVLAPLPAALETWVEAFVSLRGRLQSQLAAKPLQHGGGVLGCRHCGAALAVKGDALGARCDYCEADNLVKVPERIVSSYTRSVAAAGDSVEELLEQEAETRQSARRKAWALVALSASLPPLCAGLAYLTDTFSPR